MSRRNTSSAGTVSLFPFLAVLVCAMGALILLLLVTTRRIRQQSLAEQSVVQPAGPQATPAVPVASSPLPTRLRSAPTPESHDPRPALLSELAALEARELQLAEDVARHQQQLARLDAAAVAQSETLALHQGTAADIAAEKERLNNLYLRMRQQQNATDQRAADLRRQIEQTRTQLARADSKFAIIPYDGHSGTTRRPIIIECTADRLTFVSEGISLTDDDLSGFSQRDNPLLRVTRALVRFWDRQQRSDADLGESYVLLVVRPGGINAYYAARKLLGPVGGKFGYELVTDDQQFAWPEGNTEATTICHTIIDAMHAERDVMFGRTGRVGLRPDSDGRSPSEFELSGIRELKNVHPGETIDAQHGNPEPRTGDERGRRMSDINPFAAPTGVRAENTVDPDDNRPAPRRLEPIPDSVGDISPFDASRPRWGPWTGSGLIGFEKVVRIEVAATQFVVGEQSPLSFDHSTPATDLKRLLVGGLNREVRSWGPPPRSFYWMPSVRFAVSPGGRIQHERLEKILEDWAVTSSVEYLTE